MTIRIINVRMSHGWKYVVRFFSRLAVWIPTNRVASQVPVGSSGKSNDVKSLLENDSTRTSRRAVEGA